MAVIFWLFIVNSELITLMISDSTKEIEKVTSEFFSQDLIMLFFFHFLEYCVYFCRYGCLPSDDKIEYKAKKL